MSYQSFFFFSSRHFVLPNIKNDLDPVFSRGWGPDPDNIIGRGVFFYHYFFVWEGEKIHPSPSRGTKNSYYLENKSQISNFTPIFRSLYQILEGGQLPFCPALN